MTDTLDIIEEIRGTLRDAFKQATTDDQKQKIKDALSNLSDLQEDVILQQFEQAAAEIQALSDALQKIIDNLNGIISNFFIQKLSDIASRNGLGGTAAKGGNSRSTGSNTDPPNAPSATSPSTGWSQLVSAYRANTTVSSELKIASLAQWIQESGRGTSPLAKRYNNFGGIKYRARMQGYCTPVDYTGNDGDATVYCNFSSPATFIDGYWHFISSGDAYSGWEKYSDNGAGYIRFIAPNYSTDEKYIETVLKLFDEARNLLGQDSHSPAPPQSSPLLQLAPAPTASPTTGVTARIAIIVGHNLKSPGSSSGAPLFRTEFAFNSEVAALMQKSAAQYNVELKIIFRQSDPSVSKEILAAYQQAAAFDPVCAVELHFNSSDDPNASGTEVLLGPGKPAASALAKSIADSLKSTLGLKLRGNQGLNVLSQGDRGWISVTALPNVPSVLCEPFFGSSPSDCLAVGTIGEEKLAISYLRGLREFVLSSNLTS